MTKKDCQNRIRVVLADKQITNRWLAEQMGVENEDDVQALVDEIRYGKGQ